MSNSPRRWWQPPEPFDGETTHNFRVLLCLSVVLGYLGTLLTQTLTYVGSDFDADTQAQGVVLASARADFVIAMVLVALADRRGRRSLLVKATIAAAIATAISGLAPSLITFATLQVFAQGTVGAGAVLVAVMTAESVPRNSRAYAVSLLAVAGGVGAATGVASLPIADLSEGAWRALYLAALPALIPVVALARRLPETRRFAERNKSVSMKGHWSTLGLLSGGGLLLTLFVTPTTGLRNDWLRDERGFSGSDLVIYNAVAYLPAAVGILVGGKLADRHGRRVIASIGILGGVAAMLVSYGTSGPVLWISSAVAGAMAGLVVPALGVYGPELFPTALRGVTNGLIGVARRGGAVIGLVLAPALATTSLTLGNAFVMLAIGPAALVVLILTRYPETAHKSLEDLNPEDAVALRRPEPPQY